jgi:hypothetical protein
VRPDLKDRREYRVKRVHRDRRVFKVRPALRVLKVKQVRLGRKVIRDRRVNLVYKAILGMTGLRAWLQLTMNLPAIIVLMVEQR